MNQTTLPYVNLWLYKWYALIPCTNRETTCIPFVYNKKNKPQWQCSKAILKSLVGPLLLNDISSPNDCADCVTGVTWVISMTWVD